MATRGGKRLLNREDWTRAALDSLAEGGVAGVAVDRLAKQLGASRGSFYWHFRDRRELIDAALEQWEREDTTELIPEAEAIDDPVERLRYVFREVYEGPVDQIEIALAAAADDPLVAPAFARVTHARLQFLRKIFIELGLADDEADDRAWLAYAFYIGHHHLGRNEEVRSTQPTRLDTLVELMTLPSAAGEPTSAPARSPSNRPRPRVGDRDSR